MIGNTASAPGVNCPVNVGDVDIVDPGLYSDGDSHSVWDKLRDLDEIQWNKVDDDRGFWSAVRFDDADRILRDTAAFTSERGTMLDILGMDDPASGQQLAVTDPPRHTAMQSRLKKALAVRSVATQSEDVRAVISDVLRPLGDGGPFDFAQAMLAMPMAVTGAMMGIPAADWPWLTRLTTTCVAADDPEYQDAGGKEASLTLAHRNLFGYFQDLVAQRGRRPGQDLVSELIMTRFEGRRMTYSEVVANCYSVLLGANVTTPHGPAFLMAEHVGAGVLDDIAAHPEVIPTAVEESLRWASPVNHLMRYAVRDIVLRDTAIAAGDAVVVWVGAANRDERAFPSAATFDVRRRPNKHLAFGIGPHYCIGHNVARMSLRILYEELVSGFTDFRLAGPSERLRSNFVSGYKHVPITARRR